MEVCGGGMGSMGGQGQKWAHNRAQVRPTGRFERGWSIRPWRLGHASHFHTSLTHPPHIFLTSHTLLTPTRRPEGGGPAHGG